MDSDGTSTIVLTVATADWREAIDHLEERCERIVAATLRQSTSHAWLRRGEVSLLLSNDDEIRKLNGHYRERDRPTNVLSFPNLDLDQGRPLGIVPPNSQRSNDVLLGDIAISFERLSEEAVDLRKPVLDHFAHLLVHGTLHLLGYDHQEDEQAAVMEEIEETVLASLGMTAPYDDASGLIDRSKASP